MSTQITRAPSGLLDLVGTKTQGQNPSQFSSIAQLTIDGLYSWCLPRMENTVQPLAPAAGTGIYGISHTVPTGEAWVIFGYSVKAVCGGADSITGMRSVLFAPDASSIVESSNVTTTLVANGIGHSPLNLFWPQWIPSGYSLGFFCSVIVGAPDLTCTTWITRLST